MKCDHLAPVLLKPCQIWVGCSDDGAVFQVVLPDKIVEHGSGKSRGVEVGVFRQEVLEPLQPQRNGRAYATFFGAACRSRAGNSDTTINGASTGQIGSRSEASIRPFSPGMSDSVPSGIHDDGRGLTDGDSRVASLRAKRRGADLRERVERGKTFVDACNDAVGQAIKTIAIRDG